MQSARIVTLSFILFELFPLDLCPLQKQLSMTILYQIMIVQKLTITYYNDRYLYSIHADCLHEMTRISVRNCI